MAGSPTRRPGTIGTLRLKNRLIMAPMGTNFGTSDGLSTERNRHYYALRAESGVAAIVTEEMAVSEGGRAHRNSLWIYHDRFIPGLARLVAAIQRHDCRAVGQLNHRGALLRRMVLNTEPVGPSAWHNPNTRGRDGRGAARSRERGTRMIPEYQVYALRYAMREARRHEHFIGGDPHDGPMPMDYFVWAAVSPERTFVFDTGFTAEVAARRKRTYLRCPVESLRLLGIEPDTVEDVVISHLHYDHVGSFHKFARARFHLQEAELHYACGRYMRHHRLRHSFEVEDVTGIMRMNFAERVVFHDGDAELAPGVTLHACGGHSMGLQCLRVNTARGPVVLASDVTHFYENMEAGRPFTTAFHVGDMLEGFDRLRALAPSSKHIVPGHDPEVMRRYPAVAGLEGIAVRLDQEPSA